MDPEVEADERPLGPPGEMNLLSALVEAAKISSVQCSLLEGQSVLDRLRLPKSITSTNPFWKRETERRLKILAKFCRLFTASVDYEDALKRSGGKETVDVKKMVAVFMEDIPLYAGIVSTFSIHERRARYDQVKQLQELLDESKKPTVKQRSTFLELLCDLRAMAETKNSTLMKYAEQVILGGCQFPDPSKH